MAKNKGGRATVMTPGTLHKLEEAYVVGATHLEAAIYADIAESTLHNYRSKNPEFSERIDALRGMTSLKAKINIERAIENDDINTSKWHLERRDPDYKPKSSQDVNIGAHTSLVDAILAVKGKK